MAEASDGGPENRPSAARIALVAVVGLLLLGGGFALGRATDGDESDDQPPVAATGDVPTTDDRPAGNGGGDDFVPIKGNSDYDEEDVTSVFPPIIVRDDVIDAEPKGSAGRAFLEWWQAYQFSDVAAVERLTSPTTVDAIGADKLRELVLLPGPGLEGIEVLDVVESGDTATVNAAQLTFAPEEPGGPVPTKPSNSVPVTFAMEKDGSDWLFADTEFLTLKLNALPD